MSADKKQTIIEEGTEFDGSITSRCEILLSGTLKGELLAPALTVSPTGSVHGCVKVDELISEGEVSGEIDAQRVELSGKVSDETVIQAESLHVRLAEPQEGVCVRFGNCELRVGVKSTRTDKQAKSDQQEQCKELETEPSL